MFSTCCRVCAGTFAKTAIDYSVVLVDPTELKEKCEQIELDLYDNFNAFCFLCRRITMSVPANCSANVQICYLRGQVLCFDRIVSYGLLTGNPAEYKNGGCFTGTVYTSIPVATEVVSVCGGGASTPA